MRRRHQEYKHQKINSVQEHENVTHPNPMVHKWPAIHNTMQTTSEMHTIQFNSGNKLTHSAQWVGHWGCIIHCKIRSVAASCSLYAQQHMIAGSRVNQFSVKWGSAEFSDLLEGSLLHHRMIEHDGRLSQGSSHPGSTTDRHQQREAQQNELADKLKYKICEQSEDVGSQRQSHNTCQCQSQTSPEPCSLEMARPDYGRWFH